MNVSVNENEFNKLLNTLIGLIKPPSIALSLTRIDTVNHAYCGEDAFADDRITFKKLGTEFFLREARFGEFDNTATTKNEAKRRMRMIQTMFNDKLPAELIEDIYPLIPHSWVSVARSTPRSHQVSLIYRGNPDWPLIEVSGATRVVNLVGEALECELEKIQASNGWEKEAFERFYREAWNRFLMYSSVEANKQAS